MSTATYTVAGMTCAHCVSAVTEEVGSVPGITEVQVDLETGALTVTSETPVDDDAVAAAIDEAGYALAPRGPRDEHHRRAPADHRARDRWHDLRLLRRPHREEAQPARRRHRHRQLRDGEGAGPLRRWRHARRPDRHRREDRVHGDPPPAGAPRRRGHRPAYQ